MAEENGVTTYGIGTSGALGGDGRASSFDRGDVRVLVSGGSTEANFELACDLVRAGRLLEIRERLIDDLRAQLDKAKSEVRKQNRRPVKLMGTGYVRFATDGLWVLNRKERGFGEFGYRYESWDEMFRDLDVRITEHGTDEHGAWWAVDNFPSRPNAT
jgi:hypothetical protein